MKQIKLTQGKVALVDDEDFNRVNQYKWHAHTDGSNWYAVRGVWENGKVRKIQMHHFILGVPSSTELDHKDGNGLKNTQANLRPCTHQENVSNCRGRDGKSKFKGVVWDKDSAKWKAQIGHQKQKISLGRFESEIAAARAYDNAAKKLHKDFARLNFSEYPRNQTPDSLHQATAS